MFFSSITSIPPFQNLTNLPDVLEKGYKFFFSSDPPIRFEDFKLSDRAQDQMKAYIKSILDPLTKFQGKFPDIFSFLLIRSVYHLYSLEPSNCNSMIFFVASPKNQIYIYFTPEIQNQFNQLKSLPRFKTIKDIPSCFPQPDLIKLRPIPYFNSQQLSDFPRLNTYYTMLLLEHTLFNIKEADLSTQTSLSLFYSLYRQIKSRVEISKQVEEEMKSKVFDSYKAATFQQQDFSVKNFILKFFDSATLPFDSKVLPFNVNDKNDIPCTLR